MFLCSQTNCILGTSRSECMDTLSITRTYAYSVMFSIQLCFRVQRIQEHYNYCSSDQFTSTWIFIESGFFTFKWTSTVQVPHMERFTFRHLRFWKTHPGSSYFVILLLKGKRIPPELELTLTKPSRGSGALLRHPRLQIRTPESTAPLQRLISASDPFEHKMQRSAGIKVVFCLLALRRPQSAGQRWSLNAAVPSSQLCSHNFLASVSSISCPKPWISINNVERQPGGKRSSTLSSIMFALADKTNESKRAV